MPKSLEPSSRGGEQPQPSGTEHSGWGWAEHSVLSWRLLVLLCSLGVDTKEQRDQLLESLRRLSPPAAPPQELYDPHCLKCGYVAGVCAEMSPRHDFVPCVAGDRGAAAPTPHDHLFVPRCLYCGITRVGAEMDGSFPGTPLPPTPNQEGK